jgi:hypothetical protein
METPELRGLSIENLRRAAAIYLEVAYPENAVPPTVRRRVEWPDNLEVAQILTGSQFERAFLPGSKSPIFALRLGNHRYPHMKLQVQPWPTSVGYMLSVNTHDQVAGLDPRSPDLDQFLALQRANQAMKEQIESAWDGAGLPTFLRYLRDYIALQSS